VVGDATRGFPQQPVAAWWQHFSTTSTNLMHLFLHHVFSETPHRSMRTLAIHLFATAFSESERTLLNGFLQLIADEREGNYIDRNQVSAVRDIALQMHLTGRTDCSR
jgi:hypothetical protein